MLLDYILSTKNPNNNFTTIEILSYNLIDNYADNSCAFAVTGILAKLVKNKKENLKPFVPFFLQEEFLDTLKNLIITFNCNSIIMSNVSTIICYLMDYIELKDVLELIPFSKLREIFCMFKINGFDTIHKNTILFIKGIFGKKDLSCIQDEDYRDVINIFITSLALLRNTIITMDSTKWGKWIFKLMTILFDITNLLTNFSLTDSDLIAKLCNEFKIFDWIAEILFILVDKQVIGGIDSCFSSKLDANLIEAKIIFLRTMYDLMNLIFTIKEIIPNILVNKPNNLIL